MRYVDGTWECALCRERLDVPPDGKPILVVEGTPMAPERVVVLGAREVHRCRVPANAPRGTIPTFRRR